MSEKRILVTRSSMPPLEEYVQEIASLWESHWLTNMGTKHGEFEVALKERLGVGNVALFTNGHHALECVIEAMGLGSDGRRKVITTPFTFASTTHAIVRKGLEPLFADIKPDDYTIDPESIEALIDDGVCAIVPVHVYGNLCDVDAIQAIADKHGLKVIYDAAHAFGVERMNPATGKWQSSATFGDASMFSFHATKVFNTIEGGAVCFNDTALLEKLNQWKNFGIMGPERIKRVGSNAKMNEFCAAMGLCNLRHLDDEIAKRQAVAERYRTLLRDVSGVKICKPTERVRYNYAYLPAVFEDEFGATRDDVFAELMAAGIEARKYFYPLTSEFECYEGRFERSEIATPIAKHVSERVLTLPMYADLALEDVDCICEIVKRCAR